jgi:hypothetical protein
MRESSLLDVAGCIIGREEGLGSCNPLWNRSSACESPLCLVPEATHDDSRLRLGQITYEMRRAQERY